MNRSRKKAKRAPVEKSHQVPDINPPAPTAIDTRAAVADMWEVDRRRREETYIGQVFSGSHRVPERVTILALGASAGDYIRNQLTKHGEVPYRSPGTEVWTVNRGIRVYQHDLAFVLDDLWGEERIDPAYGQALRNHDRPIITSKAYHDDFPLSFNYPLEQVALELGPQHLYFHNSIPLVLAFAYLIGVQEVLLWGCDYTTPDGTRTEAGRPNLEYLVGVLRERGMRIGIPRTSTLCGVSEHPEGWVYGYADQHHALSTLAHAAEAGRQANTDDGP